MIRSSFFPPIFAALIAGLFNATPVLANCQLPSFSRTGDPVLRDPIASMNYQAAADGHVFAHPNGRGYAMIYSGDDRDVSSIKLATSSDLKRWRVAGTLIGPSAGHKSPKEKETSFYRHSANGEHQIYFIGYQNGDTYKSQIYLATSDRFEGPYRIQKQPVVKLGRMAGRNVRVITSPSVLEHNGTLYMAFLGWNGLHDVTAVWSFGTTSTDNGRTWSQIKKVDVPIGMEGQITAVPGGGYVAVATREHRGKEAIFAACADHPFGPYKQVKTPLLAQAGAPYETDEIIAPQLFYPPGQSRPMLFYTGAQYDKGWWIMSAR